MTISSCKDGFPRKLRIILDILEESLVYTSIIKVKTGIIKPTPKTSRNVAKISKINIKRRFLRPDRLRRYKSFLVNDI